MSDAKKPQLKFRLLQGSHAEEKVPGDPNTLTMYRQGDVFFSSSDLSVLNSPGSTKFERIHDDKPIPAAPPPVVATAQGTAVASSSATPVTKAEPKGVDIGPTLESMTLEELRRHAADEEIDVAKLKTKDEVVKAIKAATR